MFLEARGAVVASVNTGRALYFGRDLYIPNFFLMVAECLGSIAQPRPPPALEEQYFPLLVTQHPVPAIASDIAQTRCCETYLRADLHSQFP